MEHINLKSASVKLLMDYLFILLIRNSNRRSQGKNLCWSLFLIRLHACGKSEEDPKNICEGHLLKNICEQLLLIYVKKWELTLRNKQLMTQPLPDVFYCSKDMTVCQFWYHAIIWKTKIILQTNLHLLLDKVKNLEKVTHIVVHV